LGPTELVVTEWNGIGGEELGVLYQQLYQIYLTGSSYVDRCAAGNCLVFIIKVVTTSQLVYTMHTGKCGQPKKNIDPKILREAFKNGKQIPLTVLASVLGID
jgi:hypothetical protein